ncbi:nucleotidyltransferase-like protein [Roseiarcus fermentans]|uniref:Nucleotidyltransferase-like protein n=1 Tax=Roseiarcus fermentans TaxID=1473586 RepID=A0A366F3L5_9HYPH|nr:nucleotidyltransferase domain-containing protein [Roseiarcus fermentans]RBP09243.1 nucleotidyltransferase-like protein [Roseiarcus fermentans]
MFRSIERRKYDEALRRAGIAAKLESRLRDFARTHGGRYVLYGSLAKGEARYDSDVDLLIDFPEAFEAEAWRLAEALCAEMKIESDIKPMAWCTEPFQRRVLAESRIIA